MANAIKLNAAAPIIWADATDWPGGGAHGFGDDTYQLDLTSVANGAARQGAKGDLGDPRSLSYTVRAAIEFAVAPTAGTVVEYYWSASESSTAATGNDGGASGSDAAYKAGEEDEWKRQLTPIGALIATADATATVQIQTINSDFRPPSRYGMVVVVNKSGQALHSDAVEMFVALVPNDPEVQ